MSKKKLEISDEDIKILCEKFGRQFGEHFINFVFRQKEFDFNAFKTQGEWETYKEDTDYFYEKTKDSK